MQEIYLLNMGDTIDKVKVEYGDREYLPSEEVVFGKKFITLKKGSDDIRVVRNYLPLYKYITKKGETMLDIMSRGFEIVAGESGSEGQIILLSKPKSIRYTVAPLESLDAIASKFGVNKCSIMSSNNLNTDKLFVGQILWI